MPHDIPDSEYEAIERLIASDDSPVGIDAKKTHVLILHTLRSIEQRLARLEATAGESSTTAPAGKGDAGAGEKVGLA